MADSDIIVCLHLVIPFISMNSMASWNKPFVPSNEVDDEGKNKFKKLLVLKIFAE
jgi:hypothetical protein